MVVWLVFVLPVGFTSSGAGEGDEVVDEGAVFGAVVYGEGASLGFAEAGGGYAGLCGRGCATR